MRRTASPKVAAERLVAAMPDRYTLNGRSVEVDGHGFSPKSWQEVLGILADLAERACGWTATEAWNACRYEPTSTSAGMVVRDKGWTAQCVRWLLSGHPDSSPAPLS
jgi:hypothetical protein